jgi:hypothetical protein
MLGIVEALPTALLFSLFLTSGAVHLSVKIWSTVVMLVLTMTTFVRIILLQSASVLLDSLLMILTVILALIIIWTFGFASTAYTITAGVVIVYTIVWTGLTYEE